MMMQEPEHMGREEREKAEREAQEDRLLTARIMFVSLAIIASVVFGLWALWPLRLYVGWVTLILASAFSVALGGIELFWLARTRSFVPLWKRRKNDVRERGEENEVGWRERQENDYYKGYPHE